MLGKAKLVYLGLTPRNFRKPKFESLLKKSSILNFDFKPAEVKSVRGGSTGSLSDNFVASVVTQFSEEWDFLVLVTRHPIENNWFTRSNFSFEGDKRGRPWVIATTYELDEFCEKAGMPLEKALAGAISVSAFSAQFVRNGGDYWSLWSDTPEESPFGWCEEKEQILDGFNSEGIGERARGVIEKNHFSNEIVEALERDHNAYKRGRRDKLHNWLQENSNFVYFILGAVVSAIATWISTSFS